MGGWSAVKAIRRAGNRELFDDRILGSGEFVERKIKEAEAKIKYQLPVEGTDHRIKEVMGQIYKSEKISIDELKAGSRRKEVSKVRARIAVELLKVRYCLSRSCQTTWSYDLGHFKNYETG